MDTRQGKICTHALSTVAKTAAELNQHGSASAIAREYKNTNLFYYAN